MLTSDPSFATAGGSSPLGWACWVFLQSVASTLKCFSLQHIWSKWSLIAHWRMHDIKCLQTWNNHVLSLLEIVCSVICIHHHVEQNRSSRHTSEGVPFSIRSCQLCKCERFYLFYWYIRLCYCLLHENSGFPCTVETRRNPNSQRRAGDLQGFTVAIPPSICLSSGMNICGVAVFSHSRQFLYSFIKINFTWMSDLICCHKQFRL